MARHLATGRENPIFYYGSAYGGTLEPRFVAGMFQLFGATIATYRASLVVLLVLWLAIVWEIGRRTLGKPAALSAVLFLAVPPYYLLYKGLSSDGFYTTLALLGAGMLLAAVRLDESVAADAPADRWVALLGLLAGLGLWVTPLIAYFYLAIVLWLLVVQRRALFRARHVLVGVLFFGAGSLPWWLGNARSGWPSVRSPAVRELSASAFVHNFVRFWTDGVPVLFGGRPYTRRDEVFPGSSFLAFCVFALAVAVAMVAVVRQGARRSREDSPSACPPARYLLLLLLSVFCMQAVVSVSPSTYLPEPRFLLPIYAPCALLIGYALDQLRGRSRAAFLAAPLALAAFNATSIARAPKQEDFLTLPTTGSVGPLVEALEERRLHDAYIGYWTGYRVAFESGERIRPAAFGVGSDRWDRYPPYAEEVRKAPNPAVVLRGETAEGFARYLAKRGQRFDSVRVGPHTVFWNLDPSVLEQIRATLDVPRD